MCLAVPARIVHVGDSVATVDLHGNRLSISTALVPDAAIGEWVLVHAGFAIQRLDAVAAAETFDLLADANSAAAITETPSSTGAAHA